MSVEVNVSETNLDENGYPISKRDNVYTIKAYWEDNEMVIYYNCEYDRYVLSITKENILKLMEEKDEG